DLLGEPPPDFLTVGQVALGGLQVAQAARGLRGEQVGLKMVWPEAQAGAEGVLGFREAVAPQGFLRGAEMVPGPDLSADQAKTQGQGGQHHEQNKQLTGSVEKSPKPGSTTP